MTERSSSPRSQEVQRSPESLEAPVSPLLVYAVALAAARALAPRLFEALRSMLRASLAALDGVARGGPTPDPGALAHAPMLALATTLAGLGAAALAATLAQTRGEVHRSAKPRRVASGGVGPLGAVAVLAAATLTAGGLASASPWEPVTLGRALGAFDALLATLLIGGLVDYALRFAGWRRAQRLSPEAQRREARESEGDPELRARRRAAHRALVEESLPQRDWLVLTGARALTALARGEDGAPRVVLRAEGALCDAVLAGVEAQGLPVFFRPDLVAALEGTLPGESPPASLWPELTPPLS
ncbi:MAG: EscU/YscU/HrcU family type III secretion system export apparatus switch protein [Polyangiales bacterium]